MKSRFGTEKEAKEYVNTPDVIKVIKLWLTNEEKK